MADKKRRAKAKGKEGHPAVTAARETGERASGTGACRARPCGVYGRRRPQTGPAGTAAVRRPATQRPSRRERPSRPASPDQPPARNEPRAAGEDGRGQPAGGVGRDGAAIPTRAAAPAENGQAAKHTPGKAGSTRAGAARVGSLFLQLNNTRYRECGTRMQHCPGRHHARHARYSPGSDRYTPDQYLPGRRFSATTS